MKVFISWSGERSKKVAEFLDVWLKCVLQAVHPWISSKDIDRGALWFTEIADQLADTCIGVICLTHENKNKPWILFESGALAKGLSSSRVCTLLIDLESTDLENPLAQFNHTTPTKEGINQLIRTINRSLKDLALNESILEKVFETYWGQFEEGFQNILKTTPDTEVKETRKSNDIMLDVLNTVRMLDKRLRNIESGPIPNNDSDRDIYSKAIKSGIETKNLIAKYYLDGVPKSHIIDRMNKRGVPSSFTISQIAEFESAERKRQIDMNDEISS